MIVIENNLKEGKIFCNFNIEGFSFYPPTESDVHRRGRHLYQ